MNSLPSVSVVIPTISGRMRLLQRALDSVSQQSLQPAEVIVVDNGTIPLDPQLATGIKVIRTVAMAGASQARNIGATIAASDVVAFLDDDDFWYRDYLERVAERFAQDDEADVVIGRLNRLQTSHDEPFKDFARFEKLDRSKLLEHLYLHNPGVTGSTISVRRAALLTQGGFDTRLRNANDKCLIIKMILNGSHVVSCSEAIAVLDDTPRTDRVSVDRRMSAGINALLDVYGREMGLRLRMLNRLKSARIRLRSLRGSPKTR